MPLPLYLLALAVFAMGTSEFMLAGLLPGLAADLGVPLGTAGTLTSAFALGMVVGAPLMAVLARNRPGRATLFGFVLVFAAAHAVGAVTTSFPVLFASRVVAALADAGFLAVALTTATALVPPDRKGRALAVLLSGTTVATVAGVPGGAVLGALLGWRAVFWAVAALCLPAAVGVLLGLPAPTSAEREATTAEPAPTAAKREPGRPTLRAELAQLRRPKLRKVLLLAAMVNAATFGGFTFLAPVVTGPARLGDLWVPVALVLFGAGSFLGVTAAGRLADRRPGLVLAVAGPLLLLGWPALAVLADEPAALLPLVLLLGALAFALGGTLITRALYEAPGAPTMAGAYATAALNLGATAGPLLAATTLTTPAGALGPFYAAALLIAAALLLAALPPRLG
ncbi:Cmx/CmrA family chloramphenicol efflux MFS transporter [Streptomyces sp. FH025]|uniref:Cmx/CmrA family chloramphenicol efflux MFS transporter n=1 Tax=Streptomyces sp. FH025 TaxID=2815937 RepID=UPI001A9E4081|nr:Cmx/CmrA family chloramphenicol efflux MFS transporter [Streptomyces sp. FH025]MBO1417094.1 MFS transporter [Streptomyces sp. FH025]